MSGERFLAKLIELGCPDVDLNTPEAFDWLFSDPDIANMLTWICDEIQIDNILSTEELQKFQELDTAGEVLENKALNQALSTLQDDVNEQDVTDLQDQVDRLEKRKAKSRQQYQLLKMCVPKPQEEENKVVIDDLKKVNQEMNTSCRRLEESISAIRSLYQDHAPMKPPGPDNEAGQETFISQVDLTKLQATQDQYGQLLEKFIAKVFSDEFNKMAHDKDMSGYQLLDLNHPDVNLLQGPDQESMLRICEELTRKRQLFPCMQQELIATMCMYKATAQVSEFLEQKVDFPSDVNELKYRLDVARQKADSIEAKLNHVTEVVLPKTIEALTQAQVTRLLCGNYEYKIARQELVLLKKDKIIDLLLQQRTVNEFMSLAYEVEFKEHKRIHELLAAVVLMLRQIVDEHDKRMLMMAELSKGPTNDQRQTLDFRDELLHNVYDIAVTSSSELFKSFEKLVEACQSLKQRKDDLEEAAESARTSHWSQAQELQNLLVEGMALLYQDGQTPVLTPVQLRQSILHLTNLLEQVETGMTSAVSGISQYKQMLQSDHSLVTERSLFLYFHLDPNKLRKILEDLEAKLKRLQKD